MKIGITGHRESKWKDKQFARQVVFEVLSKFKKRITILGSGHCPLGGVDIWAEEFAKNNNIKLKLFPPYKNLPSPERYLKRNREMIEWCDYLIAFISKYHPKNKGGSWYTINYARKRNELVLLVLIDDKHKTYTMRFL